MGEGWQTRHLLFTYNVYIISYDWAGYTADILDSITYAMHSRIIDSVVIGLLFVSYVMLISCSMLGAVGQISCKSTLV